jgi:hypothetical protein
VTLIRLRLNTLLLAAGMKGKVTASQLDRAKAGNGYGAIPL